MNLRSRQLLPRIAPWSAFVAGTLASGVWSLPVVAQGVTTASIRVVVRASTQNVDGASVRVVNHANGYTAQKEVRPGGLLFSALEVGGPYSVELRRVGYALQQRTLLYLKLGERLDVVFSLDALASQMTTFSVTAGSVRAAATGGVGTTISDSLLRRLPTLNGDMYDFLRLAPEVGTRFGLSAAGASFRLNYYVIDGVSDRQLQNNNAPGGGTSGSKGLALDAVKEYQVMLAPFDARYGSFTGLLVNAVTLSGTNAFHGSASAYVRDAQLARTGSFLGSSAYHRQSYGFSLGGPIVRDRFHFFVAGEMQRAAAPARGPYVGQSADATSPLPVSADIVTRFASLLRDKGLDPGDGGRVMSQNPTGTAFARVDLALPEAKSRVVLRANVSQADFSLFSRPENTLSFPLSSVAGSTHVSKQTTAVQLLTQLSASVSNELQLSYSAGPIGGAPARLMPSIQATAAGVNLSAGPPPGGQGSGAKQAAVEVGDYLVFQPSSRHTLGFGAHVEFFRYHITGLRIRYGQWRFSSLDNLAAGTANTYTISKDLGSAEAPVVGAEPSAYLTDEWRVNDRLSLTFGLRADGLKFARQPVYNREVDSIFQRRTSDYPAFRPQWSPRFGFMWEPRADHLTRVRGGAGLFVGRPPLGWLANPMRSNGAGVKTLTCTGANVPAFTPNVAEQPAACTTPSGLSNGAVTLVDRNLRMAESFRASLAVDQRLPRNVTASVEALYSSIRSDFTFSNLNLRGPIGVDARGRVMYGTIDATGSRPSTVSTLFPEVVDLRNQSGGYSWSVTGQLHKPWSDRLEMHASYTHSRVRDVESLTSNNVAAPLDIWASERQLSGRNDDRSTGISAFEVPHRVVLSATYMTRWKRYTTDISLYYIGESGAPFTYGDSTVATLANRSGDLNADGASANDPIYVPRNATDASEIVFAGSDSAAQAAAFEQFVRATPCLHRQRGTIVARNSCRGSWVNTSNLSVRQSLPAIGGHAATVRLDLFNVFNLLNSSWGHLALPNPWILQYVRHTTASSPQPVFTFNSATKTSSIWNAESGYQLQLSLRYSF